MRRNFGNVLFTFTILLLILVSCDDSGNGDSGDSPFIANITVSDPPTEGAVLPETITHNVSYSIGDDYFTDDNTYRITGYFRASDSYIQVYQTTVIEQETDELNISFTVPDLSTFTTIELPYRLFFSLTNETSGTMVLDNSSDLLYQVE